MRSKQQFWDDTFIATIAALAANPALTNMQMASTHFNAIIVDARTIADTATDLREEILKNKTHV